MLSVCIPTYNGEKYIKEQIESILPQISDGDEIIISDNGSNDSTLEILKSFNNTKIKIYHFIEKKSVILNVENALNNAIGDFIFLSDQDDIWEVDKVKAMLSQFKEDKQLIMSDAFVVDRNLNIIFKSINEWRRYRKGFLKNLYKNRYLGCCMAFTQGFKEQILPFPKKIKAHDVWIGLYGEITENISYLPKPLIKYRRHDNNLSTVGTKSKNSFVTILSYRIYFLVQVLKRFLVTKHQ